MGLKITWRRGVAHAIGTIAGERIRQSLGTRDPSQAEELRAIEEARAWKRHSYGEEAVRTFAEAALSYQEAGGERTYLTPLILYFRTRVLGTIKPEEVRQLARTLLPGAKASTRNRQVIVPARAVINHAAGRGWCQPIRVATFPVDKPRRVAADREWIDAFCRQADGDGLPHVAAAVLFMWQTGTRISEVTRVFPEHIDLERRVILLVTTKTDAWVVKHISQELKVRLALLGKHGRFPLFRYASRFGLYARMQAVCRRAGLPWVPPHQAGRHSFASNTLAMGATVKEVMEAGGWKTARLVLETYAHAEKAGRSIADRFDAALKPGPKIEVDNSK